MKNLAALFLFLAIALCTSAQTTTVTATVTDPNSNAYANGSYTVTFSPNPNYPGAVYNIGGTPINIGPYTGSLNSSGAFSQSLPDSGLTNPKGSTWIFQICSYAQTCFTLNTALVTGTSVSLSTQLSAAAPAILGTTSISTNYTASAHGITVYGAAGQTANILQVYGYNGAVLLTLSANGTLTCAVSCGGGGGGVSSITGDGVLFNNSASTGAVTLTGANAAQNSVLAGPASGGAGAWSFQTAPTISAANMTNFPTLNQNTTGTSGGLSGSPAITVSSCTGCGGGGGANTALSNLASVAVNTALLPGTDASISIDSASLRYVNEFLSGSVEWTNGSGTADTGISRTAAGVIAAGNGTAGNQTGTFQATIFQGVNDGVHPGQMAFPGNTTLPSLATNTVTIIGPPSATPTAWSLQLPTAIPATTDLFSCVVSSTNCVLTDTGIPATATGFNALIQTLTGCNTANNVYTPQGSDCVAPSGSSGGYIAYGTGAGTAQAQTVTTTPTISSLVAGATQVWWLPSNANTAGAPTLAVDGLTAKTIVGPTGGALVAGDLLTTVWALVVYDGTNFELKNPQSAIYLGSSGGTTYIRSNGTLSLNVANGSSLELGDNTANVVGIQRPGSGTIQTVQLCNGPSIQCNVGISALAATAALTAGQVVKTDTSNAGAVVVSGTSDGAGIDVGFVINSPSAAGGAEIASPGSVINTPVLGTGTCTLGQFVIVDTTTAGRVKCTSTYTAGTVLGVVITAQATVGSVVGVLVGNR
jgi:hypothetical protein